MVKSSAVVAPFVRSPYNYDADALSDETGLSCPEESLAQQSFLDECDINTIVKKFTTTGDLPAPVLSPKFGDFTGVSDFHSALNKVLAVQETFLELAPDIRSRFANDPQQLIMFLDDPKNYDEAVKLGLVSPKDLSTPARAASTAKRGAGVGKSVKDDKSSPEPSEGQEGGE